MAAFGRVALSLSQIPHSNPQWNLDTCGREGLQKSGVCMKLPSTIVRAFESSTKKAKCGNLGACKKAE